MIFIVYLLSIEPVKQSFFTDIYRNIFWNISKGILWALDGIFKTIDKVWRYQFFNNDFVNKVFSGALIVACSWLILKTIIELIMNYIIKSDDRSSPLSIYRGVVLAIVMMFLVDPLFNFGHNISTSLTNAVLQVSNYNDNSDAESSLSKSIIKSMVYSNEMESDKIDYLVNNYKTIDINETTGGVLGIGDVYVYSLNFFMLFILSILMIFMLFYVGIQMAQRVIELALYKIIAPFCCTSLTTNQAGSFNIWCKSSMGAFLITIVQFICIGLLLNLCGNAYNDTGLGASIFLILGALIFIITTPTIISTLLNQQSGISTGLGGIQSLIALSSATSSGLKIGGGLATSVGSQVIGGGKKMGGKVIKSISNMLHKNSTSSNIPNEIVDNIKNHNSYQASQQMRDFVYSKKGINKTQSNTSPTIPINRFNATINPIRNKYLDRFKNDGK